MGENSIKCIRPLFFVEIEAVPDEDTYADNAYERFDLLLSPGPNLRVTKSSIEVSGGIDYEIHFENRGDVAVEGVTITDTMPPLVTLVDWWWIVGAFDWDRQTGFDQFESQLTWTFSEIRPGEAGDIQFRVALDEPEVQRVFTNIVEITLPPGDVEPADNFFENLILAGGSQAAGIDIEKHTNGVDADAAPGPYILVSGPVTWEYFVENTGDVALTDITVIDDQGTADEADDVVISMPFSTLDPGGQMFGSLAGGPAVPGQYANTAYVTAVTSGGLDPVSDSDPSHYFGIEPQISIEKHTNGEDADTEPGPYILESELVTWEYFVENTGNITLTGITVTDDQGTVDEADDVVISMPDSTLSPGEQMTGSLEGSAVAGQYVNLATVTASPPAGPDVSDSDSSHYYGVGPDPIFKDGFEQ
jgi:uncharacterized repeat protein (TIGR01451 family)